MTRRVVFVLAAVLLATASLAQAQQPLTVSFRASVVTSQPETRGAVGASLTFRVNRHVAVGGDADYQSLAAWYRTFVVTGTVHVAPFGDGWDEAVVPYFFGGAGYHRLQVELADERLLGSIDASVAPGEQYCPSRGRGPGAGTRLGPDEGPCATGTLPGWGVGDLPEFYGRRLGVLVVPSSRRWPEREFGDLVYTLGAGARIHSSGRLVISPEARLWLVVADGRVRSSGLFGVTVGFQF